MRTFFLNNRTLGRIGNEGLFLALSTDTVSKVVLSRDELAGAPTEEICMDTPWLTS